MADLVPRFDLITLPPPSGRPESIWWSQVVAHAAALDAFYRRVQGPHRLSQTLGAIREGSQRALGTLCGPLYARMAAGVGWDAGQQAPLALGSEVSWWVHAGRASLFLAAVLGLQDPEHPDAPLACEIHRKVRMALYLMVPDGTSQSLVRGLSLDDGFARDIAVRQLEVEQGACVL
jgi:hypothetical protein